MTVEEVISEQAGSTRAPGNETAIKLIDIHEFFSLAISHRKLVRYYERGAAIRWLLDPTTGERFGIEEEKLVNACL